MDESNTNQNLKKLAKQCVSVVDTATLKDGEIELWINAAIEDMKRQDIDANNKLDSSLLQASIMMFVKANFGNTDIKEKELAKRTYNSLCDSLSLSTDYKVVDNNV